MNLWVLPNDYERKQCVLVGKRLRFKIIIPLRT